MGKGLAFLLIIFGSIAAFFYSNQIAVPETIAWANSVKASPLKVPIFIFVSILICFVNIPMGVITKVLSGWLFGFELGFLLSFLSILFGSWLAFRLSRFLGKEYIEKRLGSYSAKWNHVVAGNELLTLIQLRIFPLIPLPVANYSLGITSVSNSNFILSGAIGMLPATLFYSVIGAQLSELTSEALNFKYFLPYYIYISAALLLSLCLSFLRKKTK